MQLKIILSILLVFNFIFVNAQTQDSDPYQYDKKTDIILFSAGAATLGLGVYLNSQVPPLTVEEIGLLDKNAVNRLDRISTGYASASAQVASDYVLFSSLALPSAFLASQKTRKHFVKIGVMYTQVLLLNAGLTDLTKKLFLRTRPLAYNPDFGIENKLAKDARYSFFSGHVSAVASSSFFAAKVFSDYFPNSKWKRVVWGTAIVTPMVTSFFRIKAGKHYPTDVIVGYAVGASIGYFIPHLHQKIRKKSPNVNLSVLPTGGYFSWRF
ncbi:MAG TPA: phosphatase PAP2 family protein [Phaeodactylibacter sp.]|nr:phosphatase PAP2 family protein [Phaeodactylibacter sp.]